MSSPAGKSNQASENKSLADNDKERELRERERQLAEHRRSLQEQMLVRRDYYSLSLVHKLIIFSLFVCLFFFVGLLVLSYFSTTKNKIMNLIEFIL